MPKLIVLQKFSISLTAKCNLIDLKKKNRIELKMSPESNAIDENQQHGNGSDMSTVTGHLLQTIRTLHYIYLFVSYFVFTFSFYVYVVVVVVDPPLYLKCHFQSVILIFQFIFESSYTIFFLCSVRSVFDQAHLHATLSVYSTIIAVRSPSSSSFLLPFSLCLNTFVLILLL